MEEQVEYNAGKKEESDERIIIRIAKYKTCEQCGGNCKDRNWCTKPGMTRSEAIKLMEKAMKRFAEDEGICTDREMAEVGLDALLNDSNT